MSSMEHLKQVLEGTHEVFEDCHCYACQKHFRERRLQTTNRKRDQTRPQSEVSARRTSEAC